MSVLGIARSSIFRIFQYLASQFSQSGQSKMQKLQQEFQQLRQDLQSGNLTQAQADFATLQPNNTQSVSSSSNTASSANNL
jgi:hypothetical protein